MNKKNTQPVIVFFKNDNVEKIQSIISHMEQAMKRVVTVDDIVNMMVEKYEEN